MQDGRVRARRALVLSTARMTALAANASDAAPCLAALRMGILHNPRSGANLAGAASIRHLLRAHPDIPCREGVDRASVAQALRELAENDVDTIVVSGGDGTVSAVLNTIFGDSPFARPPLLALIRGGTANMTARDVGVPGRQDRALRALIERVANGGAGLSVVERPVIRIDAGAGRPPIHGMYFGAAAIAQGIEYCKRNVHPFGLRGEIGPAITLARFVVAMARGERAIVTPVPIRVMLDGAVPADFACAIVHVTTLERLLLGLRPFWGEEAAPLHYASVHAGSRHWLKALPGLLRGRRNRHTTPANGYESHNAHRLELALDTPFFVDGEIAFPTVGAPLVLAAGGTAQFVTLQ